MSNIFGTSIGRYLLLEELGRGGMAKVYNAYDTHMERNVALKVILPSQQSSRVFLDRFVLEAKAVAQLSHTNIVKVLDYGEENTQPYIVMEYIGGGTLKEILGVAYPWASAAAFLAPIARALDYVHKQKFVHRDVKPSNILIDRDNQPMLSDFGVVKLLEEEEANIGATGVGIGTPDYMSPEQGTGKEVDFRADIYALGVVFFEMVTGQKPYSADTPMAVVIKHVTDRFPKPRTINPELPILVERTILKAVQKDPAKRFRDMGEFAEALEQLAQGEKANRKRIEELTSYRKPNKKLIRASLTLAIIATLTIAGGIYRDSLLSSPLGTQLMKKMGWATPQTQAPLPSDTSDGPTPTVTATNLAKALLENTPVPTSAPAVSALTTVSEITDESTKFRKLAQVSIEGEAVQMPSTVGEYARWGIGGVNSVAWSSDGTEILMGTTSGAFMVDSSSMSITGFIDNQPQHGAWIEDVLYDVATENIYLSSREGGANYFDTGEDLRAFTSLKSYPYKKPGSERLQNDQNIAVLSMALSSSGSHLAIGYENGAINLWAPSKASPPMTLDQYPTVTDMVFSYDGRYLYGCNGESYVQIWDVQGGRKNEVLPNPTPIKHIAISKDGDFLLTGGDSPRVYLWNTSNRMLLKTYYSLGADVTSLDISPDGLYYAFGLANGQIHVYNPPEEGKLSDAQEPVYVLEGHPDAVTSISFSPDSQKIASSSHTEGLLVWDTKTGQLEKSLRLGRPPIIRLEFSHLGSWLAVGYADNHVEVWDTQKAKPVFSMDGYLPQGTPFSPKNDFLIVALDGERTWFPGVLQVVHLDSGEIIQRLEGYKKDWRVGFNAEQTLLLEGNLTSGMIWDIATWEKLATHGGLGGGCGQLFTPDNRLLGVISKVGIYPSFSDEVAAMCGSDPISSDLEYFFLKPNIGIYTVDNGVLFESRPDNINTGWLTTDTFIWTHEDTFLSANDATSMYAFSRDNQTVSVYKTGNRRLLTIPWQDDYRYVVAISPGGVVALGSQFGSIHLYRANN